MKNYIWTEGPIYTHLYVGDSQDTTWRATFSAYDGSYCLYYTGSYNPNHAVLIVGWNDTLTHGGGTGGWIVKNSWGAGWGAAGYFTIAYGSASIGMWSSYMYDWQDYDSNGGIMYYDDDCGATAWGYTGSTTAWGLCNFTPSSNTSATRVEFWTWDATTDIDIYIYDDFNVGTTSLSTLLRSQFNYSFNEAGYHGVNLSSPLALTAGDPVIVVVKFTNSASLFPVTTDPNGPWVTNLTYMSPNGANGNWYEMGNGLNDDVAIRLRTSVSLSCGCGDICVNTTGWWRNGGGFSASATPIQSAVNNATGGDTICVKDGLYHENIDVNTANLTIKSQNGAANCVVNASNAGDHVFEVTASYVNITGFTVENATGSGKAGIYLGSADHCNISGNNVTNDYCGSYLYSSSNNTLTSNNFFNCTGGADIYCYGSNYTTIFNNTFFGNGVPDYAIALENTISALIDDNEMREYSTEAIYTDNTIATISNNYMADSAWGIEPFDSTLIIFGNTIENGSSEGIDVYDGANLTIYDNIITNFSAGIYCNNDDPATLFSAYNNTITDCGKGIWVADCNKPNRVYNNTLTGNDYGIYLESATNNTIYNNYFSNTATNAWDDGTNTWNTTNSTGPNIVGGLYIGGNYWSDYTGNDTSGDGFGNTELPYNCTGNITNGGDSLPLIPTGATLEGHVDLFRKETAGDSTWVTPLVVRFFNNSTTLEMGWSPINVTTDAYGNFTIVGIDPGIYDVGVKNWTSLSKLNTSVTLTDGNTTVVNFGSLLEGDANNDDKVNILDLSALGSAFGTSTGGAGWNDKADFNRDGKVNILDLSALGSDYGLQGDLLSY
jgi:parallel beta-helix repeat protein